MRIDLDETETKGRYELCDDDGTQAAEMTFSKAGASLLIIDHTEVSDGLRKPVLRQPEKHQLGYNNILTAQDGEAPANMIADAARLLKLTEENLQRLLSQNIPLPVARTASPEEAELVFIRLQEIGLRTVTLSDDELGVSNVKRVRAMTFADTDLTIHQASANEETRVAWTAIVLILPGRLFETRLEVKERMSRKSENDILDTSEFFRDEPIIDFYTAGHSHTWRVSANSFDFSCLENEKTLIANENIGKLQRLLVARASNARLDESYPRVRNLLELAWTTQSETQSSGWRREGPGKLSVGVATTKSNEVQFTRYSRLRYYFNSQPPGQ
jgi:hypothetical protein